MDEHERQLDMIASMVERERQMGIIASMVEQGQRIGASPEDIASNVLDRLEATL